MDDKNSSLFIDPFKYPSDDDIKNSWQNWKGSEKPCEVAAIKWLQCMGITKVRFVFFSLRRACIIDFFTFLLFLDTLVRSTICSSFHRTSRCFLLMPQEYYRMQGGDVTDGATWHKFMLNKCFAPYTDYHECRIDQREAKLEKMRAAFGEEKWQESQEQVKTLLKAKLGDDKGEKVWEYRNSYNQRFKDLRRAVDEERGIIRDGKVVPDLDASPIADPVVAEKPTPKEEPPSEEKPQSGFKGWWSEPESRLKKKSAS